MPTRTAKKPLIALLLLAVLIAVSIPLQKRIDNMRGRFRSVEGSLYLSSSSLRKVSLGYNELMADIYWLRALQYFGSKKPAEQNPDLLYHYFDIITDLDPKFVNAYRYGGTFLAEPPPFGLGNTKKGIELFDKGRKNNPGDYKLPLEEAFVYYFYPKDYEKAAELFAEASEKQGVSPLRKSSLKGMAASAHVKGGNNELSRKIWEIVYETSPSEGRRNFALRNLQEIDTMAIEDKLTEALREYNRVYGKLPASTEDIAKAGIIKGGIPASPIGGKFIIAPKIESIKNTVLVDQQIKRDTALLSSKAARYKNLYGDYPRNLDELRHFIELETTADFPVHPLGGEYIYDPKTGKVESSVIIE
jgi:tetratricopeptide (TPR) repeat protein